MAVPKKKTSKSKRGMRRAHKGIKKINIVTNADGENIRPHHVCPKTGKYGDRQVLDVQND